MAQYRAIFNNAYFKGLATAAVVTIGLAAGQAQATPIGDTEFKALTGADNVADSSSALNLSGATVDNANEFTLTFTSGADHKVSGAAGTAVTAASGTFVINAADGDAAKTKLTIDGSTQANSLSIKALDVKVGTVELTGNQAKLEADTITLGQAVAPKAAAADTAIINVAAGSTLGKADTTAYQLYDGAVISLGGDAAKMLGKSLTANGGKLDVKGNADLVVAFNDAQKLNVAVAGEKALSVKVPVANAERGVVHFASGSTIDLASHATSGGKLDINNDGTNGSVVILDKGVNLTSSGSLDKGGTISITGHAADSGVAELQTDADVLSNFLTAASGDNADKAGGVLLNANSKLFLTGKKLVLGADKAVADAANVTIVAGSAAAEGKVTVNGDATVGAEDVVVAGKLTGLDTNLTLDATNLVLGSESYSGESGDKVAAALTAQNLAVGSKTAFNLGTGLTLSSKDKGTINGDLVLKTAYGNLTVGDGAYTGKANITVAEGALQVQNSAQGKTSSLTLDEGSKVVLDNSANAASITISGANAADVDTVVLDLSKADVAYVGDTAQALATLKADKATLKIKGEDVGTLLERTTVSGAAFVVDNGGKLVITSDTAFNANQISKDAVTGAKSGIQLNSGSVVVDGTLTLDNADTIDLKIDTSTDTNSTVQAKVLNASNKTKTNPTVIQSGSFTVTHGLQTDGTGFKLGEKGVLNLGSLTTENAANATIDKTKTLEVNGANAALNVLAGNWEAGALTVTSGAFTVGKADQTNTAKLALESLVVKADGTSTVEKNGDLTVNELDLSADDITVKGALTVNGKYVAPEKSGDAAKYGLALKDDSLKLNKGATLTLGADVNHALGIAGKTTIDTVKPVDTIFVTNGVISGAALSNVKLTLDNTVSFSDKALTELSTALFGSTGTKGYIDLGGAKIAGLADKYKPTEEYGNTVKWDEIKTPYNDILPVFKDPVLMDTTVIHADASEVFGHVGAIQTNQTEVVISKNGSLNSADTIDGKKFFVYDATKKEAVNLKLNADVNFEINGEGILADITQAAASADLTLNATAGKTQTAGAITVDNVTVKSGTVEAKSVTASDLTVTGTLNTIDKAAGTITAKTLETALGSTINAGTLTVGDSSAATASVIKGAVNAKTITVDTNADNTLSILGGNVKADSLALGASGNKLYVGMDGKNSASGILDLGSLDLKDGMLLVDPEWGDKASLAFVDKQAAETFVDPNGSVGIGQNAAFFAGMRNNEAEAQAILGRYTNGNGSLDQNGIGALFIADEAYKVAANAKVVVNPALKSSDKSLENALGAAAQNSFTLESGAALVVSEKLTENSLKPGAAAVIQLLLLALQPLTLRVVAPSYLMAISLLVIPSNLLMLSKL